MSNVRPDPGFRWPLPQVTGSPGLRVLSANLTSARPSVPPRIVSLFGSTSSAWDVRISLVHMNAFDNMPTVRIPEASRQARQLAYQDSAFPIEREGRLLQPRSISGLSFRSLSFRPIVSLSTLRSGRYRTPRKTRYVAAG